MSDLVFEREIAQQVSAFLRDGPEILAATKTSMFPDNIQLLVEHLFGGNVAALSRFLKVNRYTIIAWKAGETTIDIHKAGDYDRVRQALPSFIDMRDPPANEAWKRTLIELRLIELRLDKKVEADPHVRPGI